MLGVLSRTLMSGIAPTPEVVRIERSTPRAFKITQSAYQVAYLSCSAKAVEDKFSEQRLGQ